MSLVIATFPLRIVLPTTLVCGPHTSHQQHVSRAGRTLRQQHTRLIMYLQLCVTALQRTRVSRPSCVGGLPRHPCALPAELPRCSTRALSPVRVPLARPCSRSRAAFAGPSRQTHADGPCAPSPYQRPPLFAGLFRRLLPAHLRRPHKGRACYTTTHPSRSG